MNMTTVQGKTTKQREIEFDQTNAEEDARRDHEIASHLRRQKIFNEQHQLHIDKKKKETSDENLLPAKLIPEATSFHDTLNKMAFIMIATTLGFSPIVWLIAIMIAVIFAELGIVFGMIAMGYLAHKKTLTSQQALQLWIYIGLSALFVAY